MKRLLVTLATILLVSISAYAQSRTPLKGDVNEDGVVDVADIVAIIDIIKNGATTKPAYWYIGQVTMTPAQFEAAPDDELIAAATAYPLSQKTAEFIINNSCWYIMVPDGTRVQYAQYAYDGLVTGYFTQEEIESGSWSTTAGRDLTIDGVLYHLYVCRNRALTNSGAEGKVVIKSDEVNWYIGQVTKTPAQFEAAPDDELIAAATPYPISQKTAEFIINNSCWYIMVPDGTHVQSAQYTSQGITTIFTQEEIETNFSDTTSGRDLTIDGILYHLYVNVNRGFTNSGTPGQVTIE